jgi:hypothetical protein
MGGEAVAQGVAAARLDDMRLAHGPLDRPL